MSETSLRAQNIADILWQLKKADKLATFTAIATRAGFAPGANGRTVSSTLKIVRREWPHLEWWRAVEDNGRVDKDQSTYLTKAGFGPVSVKGGDVLIDPHTDQLMTWAEPSSI